MSPRSPRTGRPAARRLRVAVGAAAASLAFLGTPAAAQTDAPLGGDDLARGRMHYIASCARCHGVSGGGGEGPPLARAALPRAPDDEALMSLMSLGIPGTAMGPSRWLSRDELRLVAGYVRSLAPTAGAATLPGNAERGRALFESTGCASCHTVGGFGTARGPDLSGVGARRGPAHLREALVDPAATLPRGLTAMPPDFVDYLVVRVVQRDGTELTGMRMNEDSYTIQLKDRQGVVHSFYKPDLLEMEKQFDGSLMPGYRDRLSDEELDDLVSYLMTLAGASSRLIS